MSNTGRSALEMPASTGSSLPECTPPGFIAAPVALPLPLNRATCTSTAPPRRPTKPACAPARGASLTPYLAPPIGTLTTISRPELCGLSVTESSNAKECLGSPRASATQAVTSHACSRQSLALAPSRSLAHTVHKLPELFSALQSSASRTLHSLPASPASGNSTTPSRLCTKPLQLNYALSRGGAARHTHSTLRNGRRV